MRKLRSIRKFALGTVLILALGLLTACGGGTNDTENSSADSETVDFDVKELADQLKTEGDFKDQLAELDTDVAVSKRYNLDASQVESGAFYTNTNATAEEIAVIKAATADYAKTVQDAYNKRIEDQKKACENYLPDEMPKLDDAVVKSSGCYVVLCISCDSKKAEEIIGEYIK